MRKDPYHTAYVDNKAHYENISNILKILLPKKKLKIFRPKFLIFFMFLVKTNIVGTR